MDSSTCNAGRVPDCLWARRNREGNKASRASRTLLAAVCLRHVTAACTSLLWKERAARTCPKAKALLSPKSPIAAIIPSGSCGSACSRGTQAHEPSPHIAATPHSFQLLPGGDQPAGLYGTQPCHVWMQSHLVERRVCRMYNTCTAAAC